MDVGFDVKRLTPDIVGRISFPWTPDYSHLKPTSSKTVDTNNVNIPEVAPEPVVVPEVAPEPVPEPVVVPEVAAEPVPESVVVPEVAAEPVPEPEATPAEQTE
jgi:hypothetical protein